MSYSDASSVQLLCEFECAKNMRRYAVKYVSASKCKNFIASRRKLLLNDNYIEIKIKIYFCSFIKIIQYLPIKKFWYCIRLKLFET